MSRVFPDMSGLHPVDVIEPRIKGHPDKLDIPRRAEHRHELGKGCATCPKSRCYLSALAFSVVEVAPPDIELFRQQIEGGEADLV